MNKYLQIVSFVSLVLLFTACNFSKKENKSFIEEEKRVLLKVDNDFAALSISKGLKNAYLEYIDSNGVLLRPNSLPIEDANAVDYIIALKDTGYVIGWKPTKAVVALSGEVGYTYGVYEIKVQNKEAFLYGTYVSIWKKQADGKWKFVLQSNNEGVGEEE
jgi:ketosteroid isomerase-like protein